MLDLPPDADDEAMVELAIALSLQEQAGAQGLSLQGLPLPSAQALGLSVEPGVSSDTASGMIVQVTDSPGCNAYLKTRNCIHIRELKTSSSALSY